MKEGSIPRVSVIIPTYEQQPELLTSAVETVLAQSFTDYEIVIIDDGSIERPAHDSLGPLIEKVRLIEQPNGGPASARNTGICEAQGEIISLLDSDDFWKPNKLARHVEAHDLHPEWALTFSQSALLRGDTVTKIKPKSAPSGMIFIPLVRKGYITTCSVVVIRRDSFDKVGPFDETMRIADDYEWFFRLAQIAPFGFIPSPLTYYRHHEGNITHNVHLNHEEKVRIFQSLLDQAQDQGDKTLEMAARPKLAYHLVKMALEKRKKGEFDEARIIVRRALGIHPRSGKAWRAFGRDWVQRLIGINGS
ncbi:MAG: glycosyltransferase [Verrucomicrobiia bacterium]